MKLYKEGTNAGGTLVSGEQRIATMVEAGMLVEVDEPLYRWGSTQLPIPRPIQQQIDDGLWVRVNGADTP